MSLPPELQFELGHERSITLSSERGIARRSAAQRGAVAAVRNRIGQAFVATGRRIMSDRAAASAQVTDIHQLSLSK